MEVYEKTRGLVTRGDVNPEALTPKQTLLRLQKIMGEYCAGQGSGYITNGPTLKRGLELLEMLKEDLPHMAARDHHELLRVWEVWDRVYLCRGAHASRAVPRGDAVARVLLSGRLSEAGRGQLEMFHDVAI
jgi:succinate dehydrogenase/fumarate reductase flavoprotein subunit